MTDKEKIREKIGKDFVYYDRASIGNNSPDLVAKRNLCHDWLKYIDSLSEEPVSEDLEDAAKEKYGWANDNMYLHIFKEGANWQKNHLWKDAQGDDLPEIDREVVALQGRRVVFAHRPNKYNEVRHINGDVEIVEIMCFDKGGWNMPDVKYWLDAPLPEGIE